MNTFAALERDIHLRDTAKEPRSVATPMRLAGHGAKLGTRIIDRWTGLTCAAPQGYRPGELVHHGRFGAGRVVSRWPDGRLLVRFEAARKNRLIFPSLLD